MINLKSCPRCAGDLVGRQDDYGSYRQCVQCGMHTYFEAVRDKRPGDNRNILIDRGINKRKGGVK